MKTTFTTEQTNKLAKLVAESMNCGMAQELVKDTEAKFIESWGTEGHAKENATMAARLTVMMAFTANHWKELVNAL